MEDRELIRLALGLIPPWFVDRCIFDRIFTRTNVLLMR